MHKEPSSGIFVFTIKFFTILLIFGGFPVFLSLIVKNYNRQAEGILLKRNTVESVQNAAVDEVKVLTQEDARALQNINQYIIGEWKGISDTEYKIRFENDNTFTEYKGDTRVGYGLWRATVTHRPDFQVIETGTTSSTTEKDFVSSAGFSVYKILRYQFESGKKSDPILHEIVLLNETRLTVVNSSGMQVSFER
jgi:hypothetical protein